jgi:hypothetical protein
MPAHGTSEIREDAGKFVGTVRVRQLPSTLLYAFSISPLAARCYAGGKLAARDALM